MEQDEELNQKCRDLYEEGEGRGEGAQLVCGERGGQEGAGEEAVLRRRGEVGSFEVSGSAGRSVLATGV